MKMIVVAVLLLAFICYFFVPVLVPPVDAHGSCSGMKAEWVRKAADAASKAWNLAKAVARYIANPSNYNKGKVAWWKWRYDRAAAKATKAANHYFEHGCGGG